MNSTAQNQQQDPNGTEGATQQVTIQPTQADSLRTKNLDTHPGITIRWSLDSVCRRRLTAAAGGGRGRFAGGAAWL